MTYSAALVVASDKAARGEREDRCLAELRKGLPASFAVKSEAIVPDELDGLKQLLTELSDVQRVDCVLTSGGTGLGPRDVTPQATRAIIDYDVPGIAEHIRAGSSAPVPAAILSRAIAGVRKRTLIVNLPGSPSAVRESLALIRDVLEHAIGVLRGEIGEHPPKPR